MGEAVTADVSVRGQVLKSRSRLLRADSRGASAIRIANACEAVSLDEVQEDFAGDVVLELDGRVDVRGCSFPTLSVGRDRISRDLSGIRAPRGNIIRLQQLPRGRAGQHAQGLLDRVGQRKPISFDYAHLMRLLVIS
jgi:hypothetical protein